MPIIVNLSALHTLHPVSTTVSAFASLCDLHATGCCQGLGFLSHWSNYAWVLKTYYQNEESHIKPYKLGQISTEEFLGHIREIFSCIFEHTSLSDNEINTLLITAWNASIGLEDDRKQRLKTLHEKGEPIYIVSNTNELNVAQIITLLKIANPDITFLDNIDISVQENASPIKIAPNLFLCLSYRYRQFKGNNTTPGLLKTLVTDLGGPEAITLISQYDNDLVAAEELGIPSQQVFKDSNYFDAGLSPGLKKTQ